LTSEELQESDMEKKSTLIRDAREADLDDLIGLLEQLFSIEKDFTFDAEKHRKGLKLMLDGCGRHRAVKVALKDNKIVGMCTIQTRISTAVGTIAAVLEDLVVDKNCRGKGIGKMLLNEINQWAEKRGIDHLQLLADKNNTLGMNFYKHGNWQTTDLVCLTRNI